MLKAGNLILRNHIFLLEIKYFCKLKELPWAELSPNYVSLFVGCFDKHIRAEALIFGLNLIHVPSQIHTHQEPSAETWIFVFHPEQAGLGWSSGAPGLVFELPWSTEGLPGARGTRFEVGAVMGFSTATGHIPSFQSLCPFCSGNVICRSRWGPLFSSKGRNSSGKNSFWC